MKVHQILSVALLALCMSTASNAQVSVNVNVGTPPKWAPATPAGVEYYYLPDIDAYYDIRTTEYIYISNGNWIRARQLPAVYRSYNPYRGRTIIINDYHGRSPYVKYKTHKVKYHGKAAVKHPGKGHGKGNGNGKGNGKK